MKKNEASKFVVLIHGWLGRPGTFGHLPRMLREHGHDVLPIFHQFDSWPRGVTIEELAERLETCIARERRDRPLVLIAHSMGGLVALKWMLRFHAEEGRRPPAERLVAFGTPKHGVFLRSFARAFVDWGLLPGSMLARQMRAPNTFLWDLAWSELRHADLLPPLVYGAGVLKRTSPISALVGGPESDGIVPAICVQPHATYVDRGGSRTLSARVFHVFEGRAHSGPRGLYAGLRAPEADVRTAALLSTVEGRRYGKVEVTVGLRQSLCIVGHAPGAQVRLVPHARSAAPIRSTATHYQETLTLFLVSGDPKGGFPSFSVEVGEGRPSVHVNAGGQVVYLNAKQPQS